ncbi:Alkaline phosphatase D-related protein [Cynara cardunculus var. scolymus]|uniref:Purple acid phosphatase n=1 Tax=Cynara cardunculus var. scolymus TaxID=59895 RepID=A0A103XHP6_CYNCS|nr:Alkaline phosphatase D-related protein [Cynara cardunculus var. scolymus]
MVVKRGGGSVIPIGFSCFFLIFVGFVSGIIPTTLDGPFTPVTVPLDERFRGHAVDLPSDDPRVRRTVKGFQPEQISISLSTTHDSIWVSWITGEYQIGDDIKPLNPHTVGSIVEYGKVKSLKTQTQKTEGYSLIYNQLYPFEGLQNYTSGIIHHVQLTGLSPDTIYYYRCGDPSIGAMSDVFRFKTMPVSGPKSYPRIGIVGDLGLTYNSTSTVSHLIKNHPDLLLLVGDATYANLYLTNGTGSDCYSCNHEIEEQVEGTTFAAYSSRFAFPSTESGSKSTMYYSFNAGGIHFLMLGGYTAYNKSSDQYKWLQSDLANVDREVTPWLIGVWHPPWYNTYVSHYKEVECMRVHAYERSNRVYNYTLDPCGPVHITVGDGGNREKMAIQHTDEPGNCPEPSTTPDSFMGGFCATNFTSGPAAGKFCWDRQPEYSAYRESSFGHGILEFHLDCIQKVKWCSSFENGVTKTVLNNHLRL